MRFEGADFPVHVLAINALGLIAPLRLPSGTGSPVNPIAIM
jgi:hypothetical protein